DGWVVRGGKERRQVPGRAECRSTGRPVGAVSRRGEREHGEEYGDEACHPLGCRQFPPFRVTLERGRPAYRAGVEETSHSWHRIHRLIQPRPKLRGLTQPFRPWRGAPGPAPAMIR